MRLPPSLMMGLKDNVKLSLPLLLIIVPLFIGPAVQGQESTARPRIYADDESIGGNVRAAAVTPDGKRVVSVSEKSIKVWDIESGRLLRTLRDDTSIPVSGTDTRIPVSATTDGKRVISGLMDSTVKVWDIESGRLLQTLRGHKLPIYAVAITPDGRRIVSGSYDKTLKVWDIESGRALKTLTGHNRYVSSVAISPNRHWAVSGAGDNTVRVWDINRDKLLRTLRGHTSSVFVVVVSSDGRLVISASLDRSIKVWDIESGALLRTLQYESSYPEAIAVTADSKHIMVAGGMYKVKVWDLESGQLLLTLPSHPISSVKSLALASDGDRIVLGSTDGTLTLLDLPSRKIIAQLISFTDDEWVSLTPEGYYVASPQGDKHLNVDLGGSVYGIEQFRDTFLKPEAVAASLRGGDAPEPLTSSAPVVEATTDTEPPSVVISSPGDMQRLDAREAQLTFVVEDRRQALKSVRVLVNGGQVAATRGWGTNIEIPLSGGERRLEWRMNVPLNVGENVIEVVAANPRSEGRGTVRLTVGPGSDTRVNSAPRLYILAIGVNRTTPLLPALSYAGRDAEAMVVEFKKQEGTLFSEVHALLLTDNASDEIKRLAKVDQRVQVVTPPTRANIIDSLVFLRNVSQHDVAVLFVAGHAIVDGADYFFLPSDADFLQVESAPRLRQSTAVPWMEINRILYLPAKALIFLDTCHSEGAVGFTSRSADPEGLVRELRERRNVVFASSQGKEVSEERPDLRHGVFTFALLEGLRGKADVDNDGVVKMKELDTFVSRRVVELTSSRQHPITRTPEGYIDFPVSKLR